VRPSELPLVLLPLVLLLLVLLLLVLLPLVLQLLPGFRNTTFGDLRMLLPASEAVSPALIRLISSATRSRSR
jgi:hypothetical protein